MIDRQELLDRTESLFGIKLQRQKRWNGNAYRYDVTLHTLSSDSHPTEEIKATARRWAEDQGWHFIWQTLRRDYRPDGQEYIYLAPIIPVECERGYHATPLASVCSIQELGLLPSIAERQTTDRGDCEGNVYLCEILGTPADAGVRGSRSAHWWRDHLARNNRFNDPEWVILKVEIGKLPDAKLYRDICSDSGIIVAGVDAIPPELIKLRGP
jgi:hypothetical protein